MPYEVTQTSLPGVLVLQPKVFSDTRGFFYESFNAREFEKATGLSPNFVQDNHSKSMKGVLRGLHYQIARPQGKLVRVTRGEVFDVAIDMRRSSPTFGKWTGAVLSESNMTQFWIPEGFAHGFCVLSDTAEFLYKATDFYHPESERSLLWCDPTVGIEWPPEIDPVLNEKDRLGRRLEDADTFE